MASVGMELILSEYPEFVGEIPPNEKSPNKSLMFAPGLWRCAGRLLGRRSLPCALSTMLRRVVELELWSKPGNPNGPLNGKDVARACRLATGAPEDVVLGLNFVPSPTDVENVRLMIADGEASTYAFTRFCSERGLPCDPTSQLSAANYLVHARGQPLAWLHFSADHNGLRDAQRIFRWAEAMHFLVVAEQDGLSLDLDTLAVFWVDGAQ